MKRRDLFDLIEDGESLQVEFKGDSRHLKKSHVK